MPLKEHQSYQGQVKSIIYATEAAPMARADYKTKYGHNVRAEVEGEEVTLRVLTDAQDDAGFKEGDTISFVVANYHKGKDNYFVYVMPKQISKEDMNAIAKMDTSRNITGTMTERAMSLAVAFYQYHPDANHSNLFHLSDMILGYMGARLKIEGFE